MSLPQTAKVVDLLKWVAAHPNQPFDPNMVVTTSTAHTDSWEWQAVLAQMEDLRRQNYIVSLRQDSSGSTYWQITTTGENYLRALEWFENPKTVVPVPVVPTVQPVPAVQPIPTPKRYLGPFMQRAWLRIRRFIHWEEMPTHVTGHVLSVILVALCLLLYSLAQQ